MAGTHDPGHRTPGGATVGLGGGAMMSTLMLLGAVMVSLALGVLVAYGICLSMFRAFRFHALSLSKNRMPSPTMRPLQN